MWKILPEMYFTKFVCKIQGEIEGETEIKPKNKEIPGGLQEKTGGN